MLYIHITPEAIKAGSKKWWEIQTVFFLILQHNSKQNKREVFSKYGLLIWRPSLFPWVASRKTVTGNFFRGLHPRFFLNLWKVFFLWKKICILELLFWGASLKYLVKFDFLEIWVGPRWERWSHLAIDKRKIPLKYFCSIETIINNVFKEMIIIQFL